MGGPNSGNRTPRVMTDEMKQHLRDVAKGIKPAKGKVNETSKIIPPVKGNHPSPDNGISSIGAGGPASSSSIDPLSDSGRVSGGLPGGGANSSRTPSKVGGQISKISKPVEIIINTNAFFEGLPAFVRLTFKAANNLMGLINFIPFIPFELEIEDMNAEEAKIFGEAVKPALEIALPSAGRKHPFIMMGWAFFVGVLGKIKARWKKPKEKKKEVK